MISVYSATETDFSSLGITVLNPTEATITGEENGMMELNMTHPMDSDGRWTYLTNYAILKVPSPVRETPMLHVLDNAGAASKTVERKIYKVTASSRLRMRSKPSTSASILGKYKKGSEVTYLESSGDWFHVMACDGGQCGWMHSDYLKYSRTVTETVAASGKETVSTTVELKQTRDQLFRICDVQRDDSAQCVTVTAKHIFYDLAANTVKSGYSPDNRPAKEVCEQLLARALNDHNFSVYCTAEGNVTGEYGRCNIANSILEDETGVVSQTGAKVVLDNFDIFVLKNEERDTGVEIRHAKNLKGATLTENVEDVITRIIPVGTDEDGEPLPLPNDEYVESPNAANIPVIRSKAIDYEVSVGDGDEDCRNNNEAYAKLRELAMKDFTENGADAATVGLDVDFVALETTMQYANYAPLQAVHMGDTVRVVSKGAGIDAKMRVTGFTFNCLYGTEGRYDSITLGELNELDTTTYGFDIAASSITGSKIINNSVDGALALKQASINYAKINQAAIDKLAADAITAVRADIHTIVAQQTTTDELYADLATIATVTITTADIDWANIKQLSADIAKVVDAAIETATITTAQIKDLSAAVATIADGHINNATIDAAKVDRLSTVISEAIHTEAETAEFTLAEIKNLVANALVLESGIAGSMMITNLAVTSANLLNATVDKLVLKGSDGKYYHVFVGASGSIKTEEVTPTAAEIDAGQTADGRLITATTANVAELNAQSVKAKEAILGTIVTESLTAGKITATEAVLASAVIPTIYTDTITALGNSLNLSANESIIATVEGATEPLYDATDTATGIAEVAQDAAEKAQETADAAQATADAATEATASIRTQLIQTKDSVSLIQTTTTDLEGRVRTIESGVHIEGAKVEIYTTDSPYRNTMTQDGWEISENGTSVITCAETKLTAPRVQVTDALIIGISAWRPGADKHLRLLKYGR